jgi:hypothetical protein
MVCPGFGGGVSQAVLPNFQILQQRTNPFQASNRIIKLQEVLFLFEADREEFG